MPALPVQPSWLALLFAASLPGLPIAIHAQPFAPADVGTTVNGYQDDFDGTSLASGWLVLGANAYSVNNGLLHVATASGDPNHLLYAVAGYNNSVQEVLARVRILNFGTGDAPRGGISTCVDPAASPAGGIDLHFRDENLGRHIEFLDDLRAWGTEHAFAWQNNTWYWLRLRHEPNAASQGGVNDAFAKIWPADGSAPEPAGWQSLYDYIPARTARTGFSGLAAGSVGGVSEFDVDYILIKASGLPSITVAPAAFPLTQTPVAITSQPVSRTVLQCRPVTFSVGCGGTPPFSFQWVRDEVPIPGATNIDYTLPDVQLSDNGAVFRVVVRNVASNIQYTATSSDAVLTVSGDTAPPLLLGAASIGLDQILVTFSEPVTEFTANNKFNYSVTNSSGPLQVFSATLAANRTNVTLVTASQTEGVAYELTVDGITDECTAANTIPAGSHVTFMVVAYTSQDIGGPVQGGGVVAVAGGYNVTGGGADVGGSSDQFQFSHQLRSGDFDLKVRLDSLGLSDVWAEAGLMARESLESGSRFASVMSTPTISGSYFQFRGATNGPAMLSGAFPVNYPNMWLRLRRAGNEFTGYAGFDGQGWTVLGSAIVAMPVEIRLGFAVASHNTNRTTIAAFRDLSVVTVATTNAVPAVEPLGQSSRRTSLVISEIMYNPLDRADGRNLEFVELFNALSTPQDISGWRLDGDADFTFPPGTILPAGGFLVVAPFPEDVEFVYGISGVLGPFSNTNSLPNTRGAVRLRNRIGGVFLEATYDTEAPWPIAADGAGHSLVLARPSHGERNASAWAQSDTVGGSPGRLDPVTLDPLREVMINEFLAHTDDPDLDFIELYNHGSQPADISGCHLSDERNTNKFTIPPGTILPPRGFIAFNQDQLGFALSSGGERIYLRNATNTRVLDSVRFGAQANGVSSGRSPDGAPGLAELAARTPGTNNGPLLIRDIVINEILYHSISGDNDDEFIELHNRGGVSADIGGWRLGGGIDFTFPGNTSIPAGGYLVVARNAARLISRYPGLNQGNTVGDYGGSLANGGERIFLAMADASLATNNNVISTNINHVIVDEVTYRDGGRWGEWSDGGGSSLELIDARSDNRLAPNWADSDESAKAPWTTVSVSGMLDNGTSPADQLQVLLQGAGECLIDNVEVLGAAGTNVVANSTFESGATGWTAEGTQERSGLETTEGFGSARSYHVRASDRGDNQVNRIRTPLTAVQASGVVNSIRARVRWLRGHPEILFRLRGNWLEAAASLDLPSNLGTPGARNSRALTNAPPAICEVSHHPPVPAANQPVVVTARVHDPDGLSSVQVRYRIDPAATLASLAMRDDGTGGDAVAGDGVYGATIPGQALNTLVAFRVQASDGLGGATSTFPSDAPARECLVRFGESVPPGSFPSYRIWMTQAAFSAWDARNNLNNTLNDVTFVLGNHRVIYNAGAVYAGSPYIAPGFDTPTGRRCGYAIQFPSDDRFLGDAALQLDWPGGHGNENTAIQEQMAYWIADQIDIAHSHRYFIRLTVNGVLDLQRNGGVGTVFEAVMQPGGDFLDQWSPGNTEGDFYRIDRAFEFNDGGGLIGGSDPEPQLRVYTTRDLIHGGTKKKTEKYRWYWLKRSFESANDYTNLFVLADALNLPTSGPELYTANVTALADVEQWMGIFAVEHIINNFDSWGHDIGKNMYMFQPRGGRAQLYMFDLDWLMLVSPGGPGNYTATTGPLFTCDDPTVTRMYNHPPFRRAYFRAVQDAVNNAFVAAKYEPVMDAKYNSLVANGITLCDGQALAAPAAVKTWFSQRRTYLLSQLAAVASPFTVSGTNHFSVSSNLVTLNGTAPIGVATIEINGVAWPVTWTSVSNWTVQLPVVQETNVLTVIGYDSRGNPVGGASNRVTVVYGGGVQEAAGSVVINEIMYNPIAPGSEFVELLNTSPDFAFDLAGCRFNGLDYVFPGGSFIAPGGFLVLARDRTMAAVAYGTNFSAFDVYDGNLQANGETLTLLAPGGASGPGPVIDRVRYDPAPPWPARANGFGPSLQLIDAAQDNARASNWDGDVGWVFVSRTANIANATNLFLWLSSAGNAYVDDIRLVGPGGTNIALNGDFESDLSPPWILPSNYATSAIVSDTSHTGQRSLFLNGTSAGGTFNTTVQQLIGDRVITNTMYTLSFWCLANTNSVSVNMRTLPGSGLLLSANSSRLLATPGAPNTVAATLPPYPLLWINEVQPENDGGTTDNSGQPDPWIELYNAGTSPIALEGLWLANNYTNLAQWSFPPGAAINPGQFIVIFADAQPGQSSASEWHTSFRLDPGSGSVVLSRPHDAGPQVLDYVNYSGVGAGHSYGSFPDGQPFDRREFHYVTAGGTNDGRSLPPVVFINEWMAVNSGFIRDPADNAADDWFELYNPGTNVVNLAGLFLTDDLADPYRYEIPTGSTLPPGGYLLVWADNAPDQYSVDRSDLHANFALTRDGEAIGLYAADGTQIDAVEFGAQTNNVSQGRYPDGGPGIRFMTVPTPRGPNIVPGGNTAPVLAPIGGRTLHQGQVVTFTAIATDADLPQQTLTFSLDAGAPPGAVIGSGSGMFTWPTSGVLPPATNTVTVRVTDGGSPPLSDFETITVIVLRPPGFDVVSRAGNQLTLGWQSIPGRTYRVEYSDDLPVTNWQPLGNDLPASGNSLSVTVSVAAPSQRFFRIVVAQ